MLDAIRKVLGGDEKKQAAAEIEDALEAAQADLVAARKRVSRLETAYGDILLEETDAAAEEHEAKTAAARREVARLQAAIPRLQDRLDDARLVEREARADREIEKAEAARDEGLELLDTLEEHWAEVVPILERLKEIDREIKASRRRASRELPGPRTAKVIRTPNSLRRRANKPIYEEVVLPPVSEKGPQWNSRWIRPYKGLRGASTGDFPTTSVSPGHNPSVSGDSS